MDPEQYEVMFRREERHWWYAGMRRTALALLRSTSPRGDALRVLDAGCGTGGTTVHLREFGNVFGLDFSWQALKPAASRGLAGLVQGSIEALPFRDGAFDLITSFDVIYHAAVGDDIRALCELRRVLRDGGLLLLRLPAHDWLRGRHDRLVHTRHRYSRAEVRDKLGAAGFRVRQLTWANSLLFPAAAAKRALERCAPESASGDVEPDLRELPETLNWLLAKAVGLEALLVPRGIPLPAGLSVLALAEAA